MSETFAIRWRSVVRSLGQPRAKGLKDNRTGDGDCGFGLRRRYRVSIGDEPSIKVLELARRRQPGAALFAVNDVVRSGISEASARAVGPSRACRTSAVDSGCCDD